MMAKIPGTGKDLGMYWSCSALFNSIFFSSSCLSVNFVCVREFFLSNPLTKVYLETYKIRTSVKILFFCLQIQR